MNGFGSSLEIAQQLAEMWALHKTQSFAHYLSATFGRSFTEIPKFERIYIAECETGDAVKGVIGSEVARWWAVDESGLSEIDVEAIDFRTQGDFFCTPVLKFLRQGSAVAVGERLGPAVACRKVGKFNQESDQPLVDMKTVWVYSS